jgi:thymidylate synthase
MAAVRLGAMAGPPVFANPLAMHKMIMLCTKDLPQGECFRNFAGTITDMSSKSLVVETELFSKASLDFYTKHNLDLITPETNADDYKQFYSAARGSEQGDYREGIQLKMDNVVSCLTAFPQSKRATITFPFTGRGTEKADHTDTSQAKCLRELHFYRPLQTPQQLHATGFMRAQAASIFPKNIHFIGTLMGEVAKRLGLEVGYYTHIVTTLVHER